MKNYGHQKTFLPLTYVEKTSYSEVAPPGHTTAYKNIDDLFKNKKYISLFVIEPHNMMFKKYSHFHWCIFRGFNFIDTIYELFDNPSYYVPWNNSMHMKSCFRIRVQSQCSSRPDTCDCYLWANGLETFNWESVSYGPQWPLRRVQMGGDSISMHIWC